MGLGSTAKQHRRDAQADIRTARKALKGATHCNGAIRAHQVASVAVTEAHHAHGPGQQRLVEAARAVRDRAADRIRKHCGCGKRKGR